MGKWVLITGASAGIGCELARIFAANSYDLVLVARNEIRLKALGQELTAKHGVQAKVLGADLADPTAPMRIFAALPEERFPISVLVNNAGFGLKSLFADRPIETYLEMLQVNITALVHLTHVFLRPMLRRSEGRILNLSSTAAFQPGPLMAVYYASKAFVSSFSYALGNELAGTGVTVTALHPGPTQTEFHQRAGTWQSANLMRLWMMSGSAVARIGYKGLMRGRRVVVPGLANKLGHVLSSLAPNRISAAAARNVMEK